MAYENASKSKGSSSVQATVDKAIRKSAESKAARGAVTASKTKRTGNADALARAYQQGVLDVLYAQQMQMQAPPPGVGVGGPSEMPFTQQAPPEETVGMPPGAGPGAGAPAMVPPPPDMMGAAGPPPGMPGLPPMPGGGPLPPGLAPSQPIAPGPLGALGPNALLRSQMPRM